MEILPGDSAAQAEALAAQRKAFEASAADLAQKEAVVDAPIVATLHSAFNSAEFNGLIGLISGLPPLVDPQRKAQLQNILTGLNAMRAVTVNMNTSVQQSLPTQPGPE